VGRVIEALGRLASTCWGVRALREIVGAVRATVPPPDDPVDAPADLAGVSPHDLGCYSNSEVDVIMKRWYESGRT
jgi:hypothetical protein